MTQAFDLPAASDSLSDSRTKINEALQSLQEAFEGSTAPGASIRAAAMLWNDSGNTLLKQRDDSDAAWLTLWDLSEGPRMMASRQMRTGTGQTTTLIFCAPFDCTIRRIFLVSAKSTTGSSGSKNYAIQIHNRTQTDTLAATAKTTDDEELTADTRWEVTIDQNTSISEADVLELVVSPTGSPTSITNEDILIGVEYTRD